MIVDINRFRDTSRRTQAGLAALLMLVTAVTPLILQGTALAAPALLERELRSTSAVPGSATDLTWIVDTPDTPATNLTKVELEFCDTPLTACTVPSGANDAAADKIPVLPGSPTATLTGPWSSTPNTATRVGGDGGGTSNQLDISLTTPGNNDNANELQIAVTGFTNDAETNSSYYTRMRMYDGATLIYEGVFAQSTSQTLTVNARVQERLDFCVGATTVNAINTATGDCTAITAAGGTVDLGNVENGNVNVSPVATVNGGSTTPSNGAALIRTNAVNGASIAYRALGETSSGALKVPGATCITSPVSNTSTDQCFNTSSTMGIFTPGTERFGMAIAGIGCSNTNAYACQMSTDNYNLRRQANYNGNLADNAFASESNQSGVTTTQFAWDANPANTTTIASSTGATPTGFKVLDNEALILKFAATAGVTTPTGAYSVQADFIATTTF